MHVQYISIGNAAGSRHNTINPTVQRHLTQLTSHVSLPYIKTTLTGNSFLKYGDDESTLDMP